MPGPAPRTIVVVQEHLEVVRRDLCRGTTERRVADRCRILLLSHEGLGPTEIAEALGRARSTVCEIRARYLEEGIVVLHDRPRTGRPRTFSPYRESAGRVDRLPPSPREGLGAGAVVGP